jgi:hypothetical protein
MVLWRLPHRQLSRFDAPWGDSSQRPWWCGRLGRDSGDGSELRVFGLTIVLAAGDIIFRAVGGGDAKKGRARARNFMIDVLVALFIGAGFMVGIVMVWVVVLFTGVEFLLFLLGGLP